MTLEDAVTEYHRELAQQEPDAIHEQLAAIGAALAAVGPLVDQHTSGDDLPDGWWLAVIPFLTILRVRLRVRLFELMTLRLAAIGVAAVVTLGRALVAAGDDAPLAAVERERINAAAMAGPGGRSWPEWAARNADAAFHRLAGSFRTARTRAEVDDLVARARKLAEAAATSTVVTGMHSAANRARMAAAEVDGRFSRWRYTAVMDSRTSETCIELNGTEWRFNDPNAPLPPRHPNCRSIVVPL